MRRKKKDKNNINNQEEIDLIPIESQQEETEVGTQPDAEPENPEATAEDTSDASLETETEVESIKTEAEIGRTGKFGSGSRGYVCTAGNTGGRKRIFCIVWCVCC